MVADIAKYRSHRVKSLIDHTKNVRCIVTNTFLNIEDSNLTRKMTEISAIFHDVGKMNPNFQKKLDNIESDYSHHSYLSVYAFLCFYLKNVEYLKKEFGENYYQISIAILTIIAHHHTNLPDLKKLILNSYESERLINSIIININNSIIIPASDFIKEFVSTIDFEINKEQYFKENFLKVSLTGVVKDPLNFFLDTLFSFSCLIKSDKTDAGGYDYNKERSKSFIENYNNKLSNYLNNLDSANELNQLRTQLRNEAVTNIELLLNSEQRVFSLTAPTGSGKTLMLLSLAGKIIEQKQRNFRIIYAIPFLSITEQVEKECLKIFNNYEDCILRIDSKSENKRFEKFQKELDYNPDVLKEIIQNQFAEDTFENPFIITTFVRFFETLVSNINSTLLKLPNFSNAIFLIDEIQALPPRLYGFFTAYIDYFCRKFNSYAIISTATMPNFKLPERDEVKLVFNEYKCPPELLSYNYFKNKLFNRYQISIIKNDLNIFELADVIIKEKKSVLVILNTIDDTKNLYNEIISKDNNTKVLLLNTHITPKHRLIKIRYCKINLKKPEKIILISTQLIEAGVDIDFPIVYRDFAPIPSIIQSAGRCNRNSKSLDKGKVVLFSLSKNGKKRAELIYKGNDKIFLDKTKEYLQTDTYNEDELFAVQQGFFETIKDNLKFGYHEMLNVTIDFTESIKKAEFETIGKFRLIDENEFGEVKSYYIREFAKDEKFEKLISLVSKLKSINYKDFEKRRINKIEIESHLKKLSGNIIQVRFKKNDAQPLGSNECLGLFELSQEYYNKNTGIRINIGNQIL